MRLAPDNPPHDRRNCQSILPQGAAGAPTTTTVRVKGSEERRVQLPVELVGQLRRLQWVVGRQVRTRAAGVSPSEVETDL